LAEDAERGASDSLSCSFALGCPRERRLHAVQIERAILIVGDEPSALRATGHDSENAQLVWRNFGCSLWRIANKSSARQESADHELSAEIVLHENELTELRGASLFLDPKLIAGAEVRSHRIVLDAHASSTNGDAGERIHTPSFTSTRDKRGEIFQCFEQVVAELIRSNGSGFHQKLRDIRLEKADTKVG
jgi:hypothetical protein